MLLTILTGHTQLYDTTDKDTYFDFAFLHTALHSELFMAHTSLHFTSHGFDHLTTYKYFSSLTLHLIPHVSHTPHYIYLN